MAIQNIPNQPVQFDLELDCACIEEYVQPFLEDDTFNFQVLTDLSDEQITNGTFDTDLSGWTEIPSGWGWDDGEAVGQGKGALQTNDTPAVADSYIKVEIDCQIEGYDPNDTATIEVGSTEIGVITSSGIFTFYYRVPSGSDKTLTMFAPSAYYIRVDSISMKTVNEDVALFHSNCDLTNIEAPSGFPFGQEPTFVDRQNLAFQNIDHPSQDCFKYYVGSLSSVEQFQDPAGPFDGGNWISQGSVVLSAANMVVTGSANTDQVFQQIAVTEGEVYRFQVNLSASANGLNIQWFIGDNYFESQTITMATTYYQYVAALETGTLNVGIRLENSTGESITITAARLKEVEGVWSNTFKKSTCLTCSPLLESSNNRDWQFDFSYLNGFKFSTRIEASLKRGEYSYRNDVAISLGGSRSNTFIERTKKQFLDVAPIPEFMHDAVSTMIMTSNFTIDEARFIFEDAGYAPEWASGTCLAPVEIPLVPDLQNVKRQC